MLNLDILLKQNINISNQLIQSLNILTMSKIDLEKFLQREKEENVMVELEEKFKNERFVSDLKVREKKTIADKTFDFDRINPEKTSIEDRLIFQLIEKSLSPDEEKIIRYMIYSLDSKGYLDIKLDDLAHKLKLPLDLVQSSQKILTSFEPKGIGALNLKDCLLAQIQTRDEKLKILIENHLEDLYQNSYDTIMNDMDLDQEELLDLIGKLKDLNPHPKSFFDQEAYENLAIPEIFLDFEKNDIKVRVQKDNPISINQYYLELLESKIDKATKAYLRNKLARTLLIKDSIDKRNQTIEELAKFLVDYQKDYFLKDLPLKPLSQEDLARNFNLSSSTVSRAIRDKYLESPKGVMALKELFSNSTGPNTVSKDYIQKMIRLFIKEEDKEKPLSDEAIRKKLLAMDISLDRRTVQKYRDLLNIPSSYKRKKIYAFKNIK